MTALVPSYKVFKHYTLGKELSFTRLHPVYVFIVSGHDFPKIGNKVNKVQPRTEIKPKNYLRRKILRAATVILGQSG